MKNPPSTLVLYDQKDPHLIFSFIFSSLTSAADSVVPFKSSKWLKFFVALTALSSACGLLSLLRCLIRHQMGSLCPCGRRETGLFRSAPRWLAKQTQRKGLIESLRDRKLWGSGGKTLSQLCAPFLRPSVRLCRCHNRVLFLANGSAGGGEVGLAENVYIQHVSAAGCCFHG